jgi:tetratricopeptide (TPR) repeat protein/ubiquitin-protein ligase
MPAPRTRRLMLDEETLQHLLQGWPLIQITGKAGIPPEIYRFTYNLRGLYVSGSGEILERESHVLEVNLTLGYPRRAPQCRMLTPVFHPNFDDSMVCIGDFWAASEGLDQLIIRIGRMIAYQEYNTKSPLNGLAAKWAAQNPHLLPIDPRPIAPPLSDTEPTPSQTVGEASASPQPPVEVPAPADEPWPERIVIAPQHPPASVPDGPKPSEATIDAAALSDGGGFRRWMRVISISALVVALGGVIVWLSLYRQAHFRAGKRSHVADHRQRNRADANGPAPAKRPANFAELFRQSFSELPNSSNEEALQAEQNARKAIQTKDYQSAITAFHHAVSLDATFSRAWIELGWAYSAIGDRNSALNALQKAVNADPKQIVPYKLLAYDYVFVGNRDNAILTWQRLQSIAPSDPDIVPNLAGLYMAQKRYSEATPLYETAAKANPSDAYAQMRLGMVRLRSHETDQGMEVMHKALEIDSGAEMLNDVAYEMAEADANLAEALEYSQRSVKEVEERSQKVDVENIQNADLQLPRTISEYWDTLGWIYFKMGDLMRAESYLTSAWQLSQDGVIGDHLGQLYEKEKKLPAALHMYSLALGANPRLEETAERIRTLTNIPIPENRISAGAELSQMRTIKLPTITKEPASADFNVLLAAGGKAEKVNFFHGAELLRNATETLEKTRFEEPFPPNSTARLLRRGILSCSSYSGCSFVFYPLSVATDAN